jgi:hypothetical protein
VNTPESREGNIIRYLIYLVIFFAVLAVKSIVGNEPKVWNLILFLVVAAAALLFYIYRFNREQRFFKRRLVLPWLNNYGLTITLTIIVIVSRIFISYLQAKHYLGSYSFQAAYDKNESVPLFWFLLVGEGIILPILRQFISTGFLFNYAFRSDKVASGVCGILVSGLIYAALSTQFALPLFILNLLYGVLFAWSYLYSETMWMPIYLAVINSVLMVMII